MKVGVYCGARWWRLRDWMLYRNWRFRKDVYGTFFNIGPILFYKER